ncbi:MAG TPA: murein L,D-transpeptidase catalytic domain family protein, partial [Thermoanaerobaculia bacterium]|nr:murein L,D-transpeptidase catalytic domain family protein [Thermoanaerobaculia bacterium]
MQKIFFAASKKFRTSRRIQVASLGAPLFSALLGLAVIGPQAEVSGAPAGNPNANHATAMPTAAQAAPVASQTVPAVLQESREEPAVFANGADGLSPVVLRAALDAVAGAQARGITGKDDLLTVIDYSLPSTEPRLWVLDLAKGKVLFHELVAHGAGSGDNYATQFSNVNDSRQTSLGLFLTGGTY